jgi:hypothetical protein
MGFEQKMGACTYCKRVNFPHVAAAYSESILMTENNSHRKGPDVAEPINRAISYPFKGKEIFTLPRPDRKTTCERNSLAQAKFVLLRTALVVTTFSQSVKQHKAGHLPYVVMRSPRLDQPNPTFRDDFFIGK